MERRKRGEGMAMEEEGWRRQRKQRPPSDDKFFLNGPRTWQKA